MIQPLRFREMVVRYQKGAKKYLTAGVFMKVRKGRSQKIVVEMDRRSPALPPIALPEFRLRHILVPVDFSECSLKALEYAVSFPKQFTPQVILLHVVCAIPPPPQILA